MKEFAMRKTSKGFALEIESIDAGEIGGASLVVCDNNGKIKDADLFIDKYARSALVKVEENNILINTLRYGHDDYVVEVYKITGFRFEDYYGCCIAEKLAMFKNNEWDNTEVAVMFIHAIKKSKERTYWI